jgi:hypothetical protein
VFCLDDGVILHNEVHNCVSIEEVSSECLSLVQQFAKAYGVRNQKNEFEILLGGWSYGGVIATEMSMQLQQLQSNSVRVRGLCLFDSGLRAPKTYSGDSGDFPNVTNSQTVSDHFRYCTVLLKEYHMRPQIPTAALLNCSIINVAAENSTYECATEAVEEISADSKYVHSVIAPGTHWTLLFKPNVAVVVQLLSASNFFLSNSLMITSKNEISEIVD